jgi:hypothetical protein
MGCACACLCWLLSSRTIEGRQLRSVEGSLSHLSYKRPVRDGPAEAERAQPTHRWLSTEAFSQHLGGHLKSCRHDRRQVRVQPTSFKVGALRFPRGVRQSELRIHSDQACTKGHKHERGQPRGSRRWLQVTHIRPQRCASYRLRVLAKGSCGRPDLRRMIQPQI